jgi:hypothetical protein
VANFFKREAKFMAAWLILVPVIGAIVAILAAVLLRHRNG